MHQEQSYYTAVNTLALMHDQLLVIVQVAAYIALVVGLIALVAYNKRKARFPKEDIAKKSVPWLIVSIAMIGIPAFIPIDFPGLAYLAAYAAAPVIDLIPGFFSDTTPIGLGFACALLDLIVFGALIVVPTVLAITLPKKKDEEDEEEEDRQEDGEGKPALA